MLTSQLAALQLDPVSDERIIVVPVEGGWSVQSAISGLSLMFLSGAKAEEKAKALAQRIAASGRDAHVLIHDRREILIGTVRYFAEEPSGDKDIDRTALG